MPHPHTGPQPTCQVTIGVDTHADVHVAAARDQLGRPVATTQTPATSAGYAQLLDWARSLGEITCWGVEGTGSYGAGLARYLHQHHQHLIEVNRPDRRMRRQRGKSDPVDADAAARAVQSGDAAVTPKTQTGVVEMLRSLRSARQSAIKARTSAINALKAQLVTAPADLREQLGGLPLGQLIKAAVALEPGPITSPTAACMLALGSLAGRIQQLSAEADQLADQLEQLTARVAPRLRAQFGVGPDSAAVLLITAGDNPQRLTSEAGFAALCGVSPVDASSGRQQRHRLNRGGRRQANAALHRIVLARLRGHQPTRDYAQRRTAQGKTRREVIRCLKRYVARELFGLVVQVRCDTNPATAA